MREKYIPDNYDFEKFEFAGFFFFVGLVFEHRTLHLQSRQPTVWVIHSQSILLWLILEMGVSWSVCPDGHQSMILPISVFQVVRIIGVSLWHLDGLAVLIWN
jgi:hypothetical protein